MSEGFIQLGKVMVSTTENKGHDPEFWAEIATQKICDISETAPDHVRQQAHAFQGYVYQVILESMKNAIISDRTTLFNLFVKQGHQDMADILKKM
jgi:Rod binding domain-containing protein